MMPRGDPRLSGARVVAAQQSLYEKSSPKTSLQLLVETVATLLTRVRVPPQAVDGLAVSSFQLPPDNVVTVAEQLGLELEWAFQGAHGGASGVVSLLHAADAITNGRAQIVVCAAADAFTVESHMEMMQRFNTGMQEYLSPYGFGGTNGIFALVEDAHRELYGTTRESLGRVAVTQRGHAQKNPNALLRAALTLNDYLNARTIADPIRLYDCVMPCAGSDAVLLMSKEMAQEYEVSAVKLLAAEQRHNAWPMEVLSLSTGVTHFADRLFESAGISMFDVDILQLYDDYPIMVLIQLEDLGFAPKGEGGKFIDDTDFGLTGELPLNTGGGQLSCGQAGASGGMIGIYEAVTQLLGNAGERQVQGAELALVTGFGMVGYGRGLSSAAVILGDRENG